MTKQRVAALICLAAMVAATVRGADVHFVWSDFGLRTEVMAGRKVFITPRSTPAASSIGIIASDRLTYTNDAEASFWSSNMTAGIYEIEHTGPYTQTKLWISVPNTNAALVAKDLIVAPTNLPTYGSYAWPASVSDQRYVRVDTNANLVSPTNFLARNIIAGTNIVIEYLGTNRIRISVGSGGGGGTPSGPGMLLITQGGQSLTTQGGNPLSTQ